jgi:hypothetical protein
MIPFIRPWVLRCACLAWGLAQAGVALAAEPTPQALWNAQAPSFKVVASQPISDLSEKKPLVASDKLAELTMGMSGIQIPQPMLAALKPLPSRIIDLQGAGSLAATRYSQRGFRAPRLHVEDGRFRSLLIRSAGNNSGFYGRGLESVSGDLDTFQRWNMAPSDSQPLYLFIAESEVFGPDLAIFPAKGALTMAHELFHAVVASYPPISVREAKYEHHDKWIQEALPDAIAPWAVADIHFLGSRFSWPQAFRSGSPRFGKVLGLRPYDYPLDLRSVPKAGLKIKPELADKNAKRELMSYMTSAFWRYLYEDIQKPDAAWRTLPKSLLSPQPGATARQDQLRWTQAAVKAAMPTFHQGLYQAFPDFLAKRVEYPDQVMKSREGVFAHPDWLDYLFQDGCEQVELVSGPAQSPTLELDIRPLAARCVRVRWNGPRYRDSGAPVGSVTATPLDSRDHDLSIESLHLGRHGTAEGYFGRYTDQASQQPVRLFHALDFDPLLRAPTKGELVLVFANVAKDPLKTVRQKYRLQFVVSSAQSQGSATQPADPEQQRPASTGKVSGKRQHAAPMQLPAEPGEAISITAADLGGELENYADCINHTLKLSGTAGITVIERQRDRPPLGMPAPSCQTLTQMASPDFLARHRGKLSTELILPAIASGTRGAIRGAVLKVGWYDPAMLPDHSPHISAETDLVNVHIEDATETYIRGGYSARFVEALHGVVGTFTGDFIQARADTAAFEPVTDPLDAFSTDALLAFHYAGMDAGQLQAMAARSAAEAEGERASANAGQGAAAPAAVACACDCAEFGAMIDPVPARREQCAGACQNYPQSTQCVIEQQAERGVALSAVRSALSACPSRCEELRQQSPSRLCNEAFWALYRGCPAQPASDAELREWVAWMVRDVPEPQKTEIATATLQELLGADAETRDRWLEMMRQARAQQENRP